MTAAAPLHREHLDSSFVLDFSTKNMDCKFFLHLMQGEADKSRSRPISFSVKMGEDKKAIRMQTDSRLQLAHLRRGVGLKLCRRRSHRRQR